METPFRSQIWLINLDPTIGAEIKKIRPVIIISNDYNNEFSETVTIIPVTDIGSKIYPFEVRLASSTKGLTKECKAKCQQIRTVDKRRLLKMLGSIGEDRLKEIEKTVLLHLGIDS